MALLPAVIGIILNAEKTEVLLIKRRDVPIWVLPGGGMESNEFPEEALKREIQEETGFQVLIVRQCAEYYPVNRLAAITLIFICQIQAGKICISEETAEIAFYPLEKLPPSFFSLHAYWLKEALSQSFFIRRALTEVSYQALCKYFVRHPWQVLRFAWTRLVKA